MRKAMKAKVKGQRSGGGGGGRRRRPAFRPGFTLIELMVVVAVIGILVGGVFKMIGAAGKTGGQSKTIMRIQRLENALSGFYSEYGTYPPVPRHGSSNPFVSVSSTGVSTSGSDLSAANAERAARSQPIAFEFPPRKQYDKYIGIKFQGIAVSPNLNPGGYPADVTDWDQLQLFRYGVLSFLLPRVRVTCSVGSDGKSMKWGSGSPEQGLFDKEQWVQYNSPVGGMSDQLSREDVACARWLPNLEGTVHGGMTLMGVNLLPPQDDGTVFVVRTAVGIGKHVLCSMTINDGFGRELYYYSAPPYQSYRVWSAGPNGDTFPPDYPLSALSAEQRKIVSGWISDDIVGGADR
jgi:prepilin-type N-terminal cleavage/methylation domain-containing protein